MKKVGLALVVLATLAMCLVSVGCLEKGDKGDTGPAGPGFSWGAPVEYGPTKLCPRPFAEVIVPLNLGDRLEFSFVIYSGLSQGASVCDPFGNFLVSCPADTSRGGALIAAVAGDYKIIFPQNNRKDLCVIVKYTVYPMQNT
jgi:hypothetical protein